MQRWPPLGLLVPACCPPLPPRTACPDPSPHHTPPQVGNWWYAMCLTSPAAAAYYWKVRARFNYCACCF